MIDDKKLKNSKEKFDVGEWRRRSTEPLIKFDLCESDEYESDEDEKEEKKSGLKNCITNSSTECRSPGL